MQQQKIIHISHITTLLRVTHLQTIFFRRFSCTLNPACCSNSMTSERVALSLVVFDCSCFSRFLLATLLFRFSSLCHWTSEERRSAPPRNRPPLPTEIDKIVEHKSSVSNAQIKNHIITYTAVHWQNLLASHPTLSCKIRSTKPWFIVGTRKFDFSIHVEKLYLEMVGMFY